MTSYKNTLKISLIFAYFLSILACSSSGENKPIKSKDNLEVTRGEKYPDSFLNISLKDFPDSVRCEECFPIEKLPPHLEVIADRLLLLVLDYVGLYTLVGKLKPHSSMHSTDTRESITERSFYNSLAELSSEEVSQINTHLSCAKSQIELSLKMVFVSGLGSYQEGEFIYVYRSDLIQEKISRYPQVFQSLGNTSEKSPHQLMSNLWQGPKHEMIGYILGFPEYAVQFATQANLTSDHDIISIPGYVSEGAITFTVPKGHQLTAEDLQMKKEAQSILSEYNSRRDKYISNNSGAARLLRDWYSDSTNECDPMNAKVSTHL